MQLALPRCGHSTRSLQLITRHLAMRTSGITSNVKSSRPSLYGSFQPTYAKLFHPRLLSVKAPNDVRPMDPKGKRYPAAEHQNGATNEGSGIIISPDEQNTALLPFPTRDRMKYPGTPKTYFGMTAGWVLRHAARSLGYEVTPDGFVRVSDVLSFDYFRRYTPQRFADSIYDDPMNRFEMVFMPDFVDGALREVWWVRARAGHSMPDVKTSSKRILNMGKLKAIIYLANPDEWDSIRKYGIPAKKNRVIPVYKAGGGILPKRSIPVQREYVCITIDAEKAAQLGVKFFHDNNVNVMAVGNHDEVIPVAAFRSAIQLELTIEDLK